VILDLLARSGTHSGGFVARANPVAKLAVALGVPLALVVTVDVVTAGTALALELLALPWCGLGPRTLLRFGWVVLLAALPAGVFTAVLAPDGGAVLLPAGPLTVTTSSGTAALAIVLRILAIGLPGVVLVATTDPTDLADALAQLLRLPHRFVLSALAALRLFGVLAEEWRMLGLARRARGLGDDGVRGRVRVFGGQVFALLVLAIRRGTSLATAMEARGFGVEKRRTWARRSRFRVSDAVVTLGGVAIAAGATAAGLAAGTWQLVLS
jgi:energy-coupling factor transport system permease protein